MYRNYWKQNYRSTTMSSASGNILVKLNIDNSETDEFVNNMRSEIDIFTSRIKSSLVRGRSIANDTSIQSLFLNLSSMQSKLLCYLKDLDDKRFWLESLQDKIAHVQASRAALNLFRKEHKEKLLRFAEEQKRQRQIRMAQTLDLVRNRKQENLRYQHQTALQRIQDYNKAMVIRHGRSSWVQFDSEQSVDDSPSQKSTLGAQLPKYSNENPVFGYLYTPTTVYQVSQLHNHQPLSTEFNNVHVNHTQAPFMTCDPFISTQLQLQNQQTTNPTVKAEPKVAELIKID